MAVIFRVLTLAVLALATIARADAQTYPDRVIKLIVPNPAGGLGDVIARTFGDYVTSKTGQPVVIENRTGASGNIAWEGTARSAPDGYTLGLVHSGISINKALFKSLRYDMFEDLVPVAAVGDAPQLFFVNSKLPPATLAEFVAFAKSQTRKLSYVSPGVGSPPHLAGDQIARRSGIEMLHVPYRGVVPAITDLIAGHVDTISVSIGPMQASLQGGTSRPLFALTPKRLPYFPDIPTSDEVGLSGLRMSTWFGIMAPKGTPSTIVEQLNGYARAMLDDPAVQKRLADSRLEPMPMTTAEFTAFLKSETPQWERAVREAGIQGAE